MLYLRTAGCGGQEGLKHVEVCQAQLGDDDIGLMDGSRGQGGSKGGSASDGVEHVVVGFSSSLFLMW